MSRNTTIATLATALVFCTAAVAQEDPVKRIIPKGQDGDHTYFVVSCTNNERVSVIVEQATAMVCAQPREAQPTCEKDWPIERAAAFACGHSGRG